MSSLPRSPASAFGFSSPPPKVRLVHAFDRPYENVVATARTCYSAKGIITEDQASAKPDRRDAIAKSIYEAGHHTTLQHAHFQFALENVSRQFLWCFLHSHPFYNSEQVSQRYVEVKKGNYAVPPMGAAEREIYERHRPPPAGRLHAADGAADAARGRAVLRPLPGPHPGRRPDAFRRGRPEAGAGDRALRAAGRDLLVPVPHRFGRHALPVLEAVRVDGRSRGAARGRGSDDRGGPPPRPALRDRPRGSAAAGGDAGVRRLRRAAPRRARPARAFREEFDRELAGRVSRLVDWKANNEEILASAVREVLGVPRAALSDDEAIRMVLDPARNRVLGETLTLTTHDKLSRALFHPSYTFRKKLSHTADSQDQRHRMTPASRPALPAYLSEEPDYIVPMLVGGPAGGRRALPRDDGGDAGRRSASCARAASPTSSRRTCCPTPSRSASPSPRTS